MCGFPGITGRSAQLSPTTTHSEKDDYEGHLIKPFRVRFLRLRAPLKIPSANRFQLEQIVKHWKTFGPHFSESFAKSLLQSLGYAPSIWLVFEKMSPRASRNEFLEVPLRELPEVLVSKTDFPRCP